MKHARRGQNSSEYIVLLVLVVVGSVGIFAAFGNTIKAKMAYVSAVLSGNSEAVEEATTRVDNAATKAAEAAREANSIRGIDKDKLEMKLD